jgi:hypothetical protein
MSSSINTKLTVLVLAGSALAAPGFGHGGHHAQHHHHKHVFGTSGLATGTGAPYGMANATGIWASGTGLVASTGLVPSFVHPSPIGPHTASSEVAAITASTGTCTDDVVLVTHTNRVTVTVYASDVVPALTSDVVSALTTMSTRVASNSVALSSSVLVNSTSVVASSAPASSSSISLDINIANKGFNGHRHSWGASSSTAAAHSTSNAVKSTSQSYVAPVVTSSSSSIHIVPVSTSVYVAPSSSAAARSSSVQASSASSAIVPKSSSAGAGKRGLAYNTASLLTCFENNDQVTWGYNWDSASGGLSNNFNYVPLLWGTTNGHADVWNARATAAIASGATHLMSFNEPDMTSQANMSPSEAAAAYKTYMMPFAGKAKLGAPAVTNGAGSMGLNWLNAFLEACTGCQIDFVSIHWYDSAQNTAYFKEHVQNATTVSGKPVWVTEFAPTEASDADISTFLQDVMPWMDAQDFVERYSYFMAGDGALISGTEPSVFGTTYAKYTSSS